MHTDFKLFPKIWAFDSRKKLRTLGYVVKQTSVLIGKCAASFPSCLFDLQNSHVDDEIAEMPDITVKKHIQKE